MNADDAYLFREGTHARLYEHLGCHLDPKHGGARFGVWAPNARAVSVIGDWNGWRAGADKLAPRSDQTGIWEGHVAGVQRGQAYKFRIESNSGGHVGEKADPFAIASDRAPRRRGAVITSPAPAPIQPAPYPPAACGQ
ncbi:MAG: hypothetical protein O2979_10760 [Proteobacteria bacterium]|nr:hypothetical protein [Pseudomonadota bacterium]